RMKTSLWVLVVRLAGELCAQWRLEASGGGVRAPGDSVQLSCRGYGFKFGGVWWYRQAPGGHLKWLSDISKSSYVRASPEVEGRLKGSRDDSRAIISLSLHNLRPEDSARYFCAITREQEILQSCNNNPFLDTAKVAGYKGLEGAGAALGSCLRVRKWESWPDESVGNVGKGLDHVGGIWECCQFKQGCNKGD
uniref:Ig-like domain-containing protein n=1 Tax=Gallus gallus TaxID=9031 RepID=A0A8V1AAU1_CHICK